MKTEDKLKVALKWLDNRWQLHPQYRRYLHPQHPVIGSKLDQNWMLSYHATLRKLGTEYIGTSMFTNIAIAVMIAVVLLLTLDWIWP